MYGLDGPMKTGLKSNRSRIHYHRPSLYQTHHCLTKFPAWWKNNLEENAFQQSHGRFPHKLTGLE